ncbi:MAG: redoxin domain-containing protein, partial [Pirellulaceae bacterium]
MSNSTCLVDAFVRDSMPNYRASRPLSVLRVASLGLFLGFYAALPTATADEAKLPAVGDEARDFELADLHEESFRLSSFTEQGPVVLVVLRGFPGYQCPICSRQVGQYISAADKLKAAKATVLMVYPGPADGLKPRAEEFITGKTLPEGFHLLIDPDYTFTNAWRLRWVAPRETAFPSTFVIGQDGSIRFAKISKTHGDRASVDDVLKALSTTESSNAAGSEDDASAAADVLERVRTHDFHPLHEGFTKDSRLEQHGLADLSNDDWRVRTLAIRDLARIGSPAVPSLLVGLQDDDLHVRQVSALVLGILPTTDIPTEALAGRLRGLEERL